VKSACLLRGGYIKVSYSPEISWVCLLVQNFSSLDLSEEALKGILPFENIFPYFSDLYANFLFTRAFASYCTTRNPPHSHFNPLCSAFPARTMTSRQSANPPRRRRSRQRESPRHPPPRRDTPRDDETRTLIVAIDDHVNPPQLKLRRSLSD
jgi:hypothetical protein